MIATYNSFNSEQKLYIENCSLKSLKNSILKLFLQKINNFDILSQEIYIQKIDDDNKNKFKLIINNEDNYKLLNKKIIGCLKFINNSHLTKEKLLTTAYDEYNQDNEYNNKIFCSTVFESKGLEYEIVILYNFFKDSLPFIKDIWTIILKNINITQVENNNLYLIKQNLDFENFPLSIKDQIYSIFNKKFNIEFLRISTNNFQCIIFVLN